MDWKREWFPNWENPESRKNFLEKFAKKFNIKEPKDWGNISTQLIHEEGGGAMIHYYYNNSLFECLQNLYQGSMPSMIH